MFRKSKTLVTAAIFYGGLPFAALAVPIAADTAFTFAGILDVGGTTTFAFDVTEDLDISDFAVNATDTNGGADIEKATFSYNLTIGDQFDTIVSSTGVFGDPGATGIGASFISGWGGYSAGDSIVFTFYDGIDDPVSLGLSFQTTAPITAVPTPGAGGLLAVGLIGAGLVARRRAR